MTSRDPLSRSGLRGREAELEKLRALIASVVGTGCGGLLLIRGEPGIGKSTLLAEAVSRAEAAGFSVGVGRSDELHAIVPFSSLAAAVVHRDQPLLSADALVGLARHHDQRIWLVERVAEAIEARAESAPVLIALDDVQWADPLSRFAVKQLPARLATSPVLWVLAAREDPAGPADEIVAESAGHLPVVTMHLRPLSSSAIGQLAGDTLGAAVDRWVRDLLDGAGGNPFLAVEMLAGLPAVANSGGVAHPDLVPPGLVVGVRGRLKSLQPDTLRFLQVGAVLGREFRFHEAAALRGRPATSLIAALEEAVRAGLLDDDGDQLVFRHDLLRQAVYVDIPPSARKALHRQAAYQLARAGRPPIDTVPHVLRGAVPGDEDAVALLRRAADDVLSVTPGLAADLMTRALEWVPAAQPLRFEVGEQAIVSLTRAGRSREALATGDRLLALRPPLPTFSRIQAALGGTLWSMDLAEELGRRAETALATGSAAPEVAARLTALRALAMSRGRDLAAAREVGELALRDAVATGDRQAHVLALSGLGEIAQNAGENAVALERFTALSAVDPAFLPEQIVAHLHLDDFASGERLFAQASDDTGPVREAMMLWARGLYDLGLGRLDDADADLVTMERLEDDVQVPVQQVNARVIRSWTALLRGDREAAREHLAAARKRLAAKPNPGNTAAVRFLEAVHADADGDADVAVDKLRQVQQEGLFMRWRLLRDRVDSAVRIALRASDSGLAEDLAAQAEAYARGNPDVPTAQGIAAQAAGLVKNDRAMLGRAVELLAASPRPLVRAAAQRDLDHAAGRGRPPAPAQRPIQGWGALTVSEKKVARLIAEGHTNRSAADFLVVSPHTVNTHLTSAFRKLSVNSRVQLANVVRTLPEE